MKPRNRRTVAEYRLLTCDLSPYTVTYELWVRPAKPVFPLALKSAVMNKLLKEFGEMLSVPVLLRLVGQGAAGSTSGGSEEERE